MLKPTGKKVEVNEYTRECDFCHKTMDAGSDNQSGLECSSVIDFNFGYFSTRDGDQWQWELCHLCADKAAKLLETLKANAS